MVLFFPPALGEPDLVLLKHLQVRTLLLLELGLLPNVTAAILRSVFVSRFAFIGLDYLLHVELVGLDVALQCVHHLVEIDVWRIYCLVGRFEEGVPADAVAILVALIIAEDVIACISVRIVIC